MNVSVKCVDLLKKTFIFVLVLIMICSVFPASIFKTLGLQKTVYATYDPYSQFFTKAEEMMVGKDWTDGVDYSELDFSLSGSYYSANIATMDRSLLDGYLHISKTNPDDQNAQDNYSRFTFDKDLNAIVSKQATNGNGGILKLTFRAPVAGTYRISPENILGTDDKSMLLRMAIKDYDDVSLYNQTFKISKGNEELFSKTLTLDEGFKTVYDNIPDDITAELGVGEELTFSFEAGATWAVTELCVRFSILLTDYSSTDVTGVYFLQNNYATALGTSLDILPVIIPATATNKNIIYKVEDESVLSVDSNGKVTGKKAGYSKVTAKTEDGGFEAETTVCIYAPDEACYSLDELYNNAVTKFEGESSTQVKDNDIASAWQPKYKNSTGYINCENVVFTYNPWAGLDFSIRFYPENGEGNNNYSGLEQYEESGRKFYLTNYGRQDTYPNGIALEFTAPEYGIYTLLGDENISLTDTTINYITGPYGDPNSYFDINFYLNGSKIHSEKLTTLKTSTEFPTINYIEMQKNDKLLIEVDTNVWERGQVLLYPKMVFVSDEKPIVPPASVTLDTEQVALKLSGTYTLQTTVLPDDAADKSVSYTTSNADVATVSETGVITAVGVGTATITVKSNANENLTDSVAVTVSATGKNFIKALWPEATQKVTVVNKNTPWDFTGSFTAGVLSGGIYTNFNYALKHDWGNPSAIMFNNNPDENGSGISKQTLSFYDGKSAIGSYVDSESVYAGFKALEDGVYTFGPSEVCDKISIELSSVCTIEDLIDWGEDKPFYIKITKNGEQIWPKGNNGYELKPSTKLSVEIPTIKDIKLYKGDELRIEVSGQSGILNRHATVTLDFDITKQKDLEVKNHVTSIKLSDSKIELSKGESHKLSATVLPKNADNKNVKYKSSNTTVATVDSTGKITAIKQGNAVIYAISCENESVKAECKVTVSSFEVINYTPDELKESLNAQLGKEIVVNSKVIEWNTNWSAQYLDNKDNIWKSFPALTTYDWREEGKVSAYSFKFSNWTNVGLENLNGYYQPYVSTEDQTVALAFTAHIAGNYRISPDIRNSAIYIPSTYIEKHIVKQDRDKKYKFSITVNGKSIYTAELSWQNKSIAFPTIEDIYLGAEDVVRFVIEDNLDSTSPIDIYFSPVVSLVKPDPTVYAPIVHDASYTVDKNSTLNGKINAIHPNGLAMNFQALSQSSNSNIKISSDGSFIYTPKKNYKGIETIKVKVFDSRGKSSVAKLTFMVTTGYDGVALLSETLLKADSLTKGKGEVKGFTYPENTIWKYQYTYDGLCYANGSPKYYDTNLVEVIVNAGWWGYTTFSEGMPQATIMDIDGVPAMQIMAGNAPWGANPIGAMSFFAPNDGLYLLKAKDTFQEIKLTADLESGIFKQPVRVWIAKNGKKIWPENQDSIELSAEQTEIDFPEITVAMKKGDSLRVCISGHYENERQNIVAIAPVVYDIGAYNSSLDLNPNIEGGKVIEDDEGEPIVAYSSLKLEDVLPLSAKGFKNIIIDEKTTLDKILKPTKTFDFGFEAAWKECSNAKGYIVLIYSVSGEDYTLERELYVEDLSVSIEELMAGEYMLQVIAVDEYGQYSEVYSAKEFSVSEDGKITFESTGNMWIFVIIIAGGILLIAIASFVFLRIIRKRKAGLSIEKGNNS